MANIDWDSLNAKLPLEKNDEDKAKRQELFKQFDPNGNGYLSLAEVQRIKLHHKLFLKIFALFCRSTRVCEMFWQAMNSLIVNRYIKKFRTENKQIFQNYFGVNA